MSTHSKDFQEMLTDRLLLISVLAGNRNNLSTFFDCYFLKRGKHFLLLQETGKLSNHLYIFWLVICFMLLEPLGHLNLDMFRAAKPVTSLNRFL